MLTKVLDIEETHASACHVSIHGFEKELIGSQTEIMQTDAHRGS
jgi:hypothetical protein